MTSSKYESGLAVPRSRLSRMARISGLGAGVAGSVMLDGAKRFAQGERPNLEDLLLTPKNITRVTEELSRLRGAAMKVGQLLSMDGGDVIAPELAEILSRLRSSAYAMPPAQLKRVLIDNWGRHWMRQFERFDVRPIAAASIGQVHKARTRDGRDLAVKIQYPGVRDSIESDVDNVAGLVRVARLLPPDVDIAMLLDEAKRQLQEEADYQLEAEKLSHFHELLAEDDRFLLPQAHNDLTTRHLLAMSYLPGAPIEDLADAPAEQRDQVVHTLMDLVLKELFDFKMMQTDPNFANYLFDKNSGKIILLDFGAARQIPAPLSEGYRAVLAAGVARDWPLLKSSLQGMGLAGETIEKDHEALLRDIMELATEPMRHQGPYDFGSSDLAFRLRDKGVALRGGGYNHVPPPLTLFLHRKIGGTYLLATKLRAKVDVGALVEGHIDR